MKQVNDIGVDVDSEKLVCAMQRAEQRQPLATFANTAAGHKKFLRWATKGGRPARVCLEATGIYSLEFALALHYAQELGSDGGQPARDQGLCSSVYATSQN